MKQDCTRRELTMAAAIAAVVALAGSSALAQTATTTDTTAATATTPTASSAGVLTTAASKPAGGATPEMISEAIQRSQARSDNLKKNNKPEQWGSEEPFTFNPAK